MMAIVVNGDACKPEDVEKAFAAIDGVDAVVSTIGGTTADPAADSQVLPQPGPAHRAAVLLPRHTLDPTPHHAPTAGTQGNINLIDAAVRHGVKKFVLVTSIGTGAQRAPACGSEALSPAPLQAPPPHHCRLPGAANR